MLHMTTQSRVTVQEMSQPTTHLDCIVHCLPKSMIPGHHTFQLQNSEIGAGTCWFSLSFPLFPNLLVRCSQGATLCYSAHAELTQLQLNGAGHNWQVSMDQLPSRCAYNGCAPQSLIYSWKYTFYWINSLTLYEIPANSGFLLFCPFIKKHVQASLIRDRPAHGPKQRLAKVFKSTAESFKQRKEAKINVCAMEREVT